MDFYIYKIYDHGKKKKGKKIGEKVSVFIQKQAG